MSKILLRHVLLRKISKFKKSQSMQQQKEQQQQQKQKQQQHQDHLSSVMEQQNLMLMRGGEGTRTKREPIYDFNRSWVTTFDARKQQKQPPSSSSSSSSISSNGQKTYKLLSYNILAQDLLIEHLQLYININQSLLSWEKRIMNIQQEIVRLDPDIVCLQEMQFNHLQQFVKRIGCGKRLEYVFKKKTGFRTDGCAIIYNRDKFHLMEDRNLEYYNDNIPILNRENIAILAKFRLKEEPNKEFVVSTTHLLYNPRREDVRSAQVGTLLKTLTEFATTKEWPRKQLPVLLTGDFNFESDSKSFGILTSSIEKTNDEDNGISTPNAQYKNENVNIQMKSLNFGPFTGSTFQDRWLTVDYILYSVGKTQKNNINVRQLYKLPSLSDCERVGQIPNRYLGSDHYSLGIIFSVN